MALTQQFETQRDLLTGMLYKRGETSVVERFYTYDNLGRPLTRQQNRQGGSRSDTFMHNDRSELTSATIGSDSYAYAYDNIGNRKTAQENAEEVTNYDANALNQYTAVGDFVPKFDADGNQTKVQTSTGIWNVIYNAENRPITFSRTNNDGSVTKVTCAYDFMGRRTTKKVETLSAPDAETGESTTTLHQRYLYRGYLQIACCDLTRENHPLLWLITWDPTQPVATRPLAIRKDGTWYCYGWDLTKNVCEVFSNEGRINNTVIYSYTPYGAVSAEGSVQQPIQWSGEFYDGELGLVYYNYRYYNAKDGRWFGKDFIDFSYSYVDNRPITKTDVYGLLPATFMGYENPRFQKHDKLIEELVQDFNNNKALYAGCSEEKAKCIPDLDESLLKSMMLQESGGSPAAWDVDPLQVNVPGDYDEEVKKPLGLSKPKKRNEGDVRTNLKAALMLLVRKGFGISGKAPKTTKFDTWEDAIRRYNGRTDIKNGKKYSERYRDRIYERYNEREKHIPIQMPR